MTRFGVYYDDGGMGFGWLAHEGSHGRPYRAEFSTLEEAQESASRETAHDPSTTFYASSFEVDHQELFKSVRKIVNAKRLERAERELERAKTAIKDDDKDRRTAYDRLLEDD